MSVDNTYKLRLQDVKAAFSSLSPHLKEAVVNASARRPLTLLESGLVMRGYHAPHASLPNITHICSSMRQQQQSVKL